MSRGCGAGVLPARGRHNAPARKMFPESPAILEAILDTGGVSAAELLLEGRGDKHTYISGPYR